MIEREAANAGVLWLCKHQATMQALILQLEKIQIIFFPILKWKLDVQEAFFPVAPADFVDT